MTHHISLRSLAVLCGLLAGASLTPLRAQTSTNVISETTFDANAPSAWGYGYYYGNNGLGTQLYDRAYYSPDDTDLTNAMWHYTFDLTDLAGMAGYGTGTGGPLFLANTAPGQLTSTNREDYLFSFDARVGGLEAAQTTANAEMQVQFYYPDANNQAVKVLQVNLPFTPGTNWQHFTFDLGQGGLGDNTTEADFALHHAEINDVRFNVNLHEPHTAYGFDADNSIDLDNVRLQVVNRPATPPPATRAATIAEWNFDDKPAASEYHYEWSQNETHAVVSAGNNANGTSTNTLGKDGTSGWFLTLDTTEFSNNQPQWAGGGTGGSGPVDFTKFDTNDLAGYRVTFDARVLGLVEDRTNTTAALQLFLDAPDDTVLPADDDANPDLVLRLDFPISKVSSNWQAYSFLLSKGSVGGGSKTNLDAAVNKIVGLRTQWQMENAASADWGFDADNTVIIDNFKLERLYPESGGGSNLGALSATRNGENLVLTWNAPATGAARLQSATNIAGPYTDVAGAASGYSTPLTGPARFFRLVE